MYGFGALRQLLLIIAFALIVGTVRPAGADGPATTIEGNHPDEAADIVGAAAASMSQPLAMRFTMALRNRGELAHLLAEQQDPASSQYHRWLTPDAFTSRFGPTDADVARVAGWLKKKGFTVSSADASTREVSFTGTVAQAQNVFGVKIAASIDGRMYSNTSDPSVPAELSPMVESIHGLDNLLHSKPMVHRVAMPASGASSPASVVNTAGPSFGPPDIYTFYDETPLLNRNIDGGGIGCIAVVEDSNIDLPAADAFNTQFSLPQLIKDSNFQTVMVDGSDPGLNGDEDEAMVDVSYSHSVAPGSTIRMYLGDQNQTSGSAILDAIHAAVTETTNPCSAISISFSFCGGSKKFYQTQGSFFTQAAAQGQSVFVATGDTGAAGLKVNSKGVCVRGTTRNVNEIGASPNVTAIGGTEFSPHYSGGEDVGSVSESVWNDVDGAGGGGQSKFFKKPTFQNGLFKSDKMRDVPDVSFGASPATPGFFFGGRDVHNTPKVLCCIGGTSLGAPAWAGISQLISQSNGAPIGNLNARIYQLGAEPNSAMTGIRDVTSGNTNFHGITGFSAKRGYDKASGWGTVDMEVFVGAYLSP